MIYIEMEPIQWQWLTIGIAGGIPIGIITMIILVTITDRKNQRR